MRSALIWLNKYLSNTWEILALLREARQAAEFDLLCTHPFSRYAGQRHCESFEQEPDKLSDDEYVAYCLDVVRRRQVTHFMPGRKLLAIVRAGDRFAEAGATILAAGDAATLHLLSSKARVYAEVADLDIPLPEYEVVNDLAEFDTAWASLRPRHHLLCYKPAVSVYGIGFHIVADREPALASLATRDRMFISLEDARGRLAAKGRFRDLLVMQYLHGPERSVDCLARDGELLRCIVRRKEQDAQVIEENPRLVEMVRRLTAKFRLNHLYNVQFRDHQGRTYLLEINPRMSGGLPFACQSGLVLPYWAIRLALGTASPTDIPQPRTGIRVPQPEPVSSL